MFSCYSCFTCHVSLNTLLKTQNVAVQCPSPTISTSRTVSRTTGSQVIKCLTFWGWRTMSFSGVSQRSQTPQHFRGPTEASALTSCVISTSLPTCRPAARFSLCSCWAPTGGVLNSRAPTLRRRMSTPMRPRLVLALNCTPPRTQTRLHSSFQTFGSRPAFSLTFSRLVPATVGGRQPRNVPPLHTAQAVHEVVAEEYRILDSVNCELATYTPADWMCLFETRFSLSVEHLRLRFPQRTGSLLSLLARVPSGVLASLVL